MSLGLLLSKVGQAAGDVRDKRKVRQADERKVMLEDMVRQQAGEDRTRRLGIEDEIRRQAAEDREYEIGQRPLEEEMKRAQLDAIRNPAPTRAQMPTEGERKASAFLTSGQHGYDTLERLLSAGKGVPSWKDQQLAKIGMGTGNVMTGDEYRQMRQSALQLSDAWLRYTSGAAVPEQEVERFAQSFIPAAGDDPATLKQKAASRASIMTALRRGAGRAAPPPAQQYVRPNPRD